MNKELNIEILAEKEVCGTLNAQEQSELEDWLSADPLHRKQFDELTEIVRLSQAGLESVDPKTDAMWANLQASMADDSAGPLRRRPRYGRVWAMAASVVLLCAVGYFVIQGGWKKGTVNETIEYAATNKVETFLLPDQSEVQLQPGSRLSLSPAFNEEERRMNLEGEALFTVTRDEKKPFVVEAGGTETRVLGTVFELKTSPEIGEVDLYVVSGKVSFAGKDSDQPAILTADMRGKFDGRTGKISVKNRDLISSHGADSPRQIVARNRPIRELLPELEEVYSVQFKIPEDLQETHITGTFSATAEADMIAALELILDGKFEKKDANYIFTPRQ